MDRRIRYEIKDVCDDSKMLYHSKVSKAEKELDWVMEKGD
jgi:hypothetical protein